MSSDFNVLIEVAEKVKMVLKTHCFTFFSLF